MQSDAKLGFDVAGVEIDNHGLHLLNIGGLRLSLFGDGARDGVDGRALAPRPGGEGRELLQRRGVGLDPMLWGFPSKPCPLSTKPRTGISPSQ